MTARRAKASDPVVLAMSADDRYAIGLAVTVRSALERLRGRPVELTVADGGLSVRNRERILRSFDGFAIATRFVKPDVSRVKRLKTRGYIRTPTYFRLLLPDLVPKTRHKALYLDADLLVNADLGRLFDTPLEGHAAAAVHSLMCPHVVCISGILNFAELGLPPETPYFNAGVVLMDLDQWRKDRIGAEAIAYVERNRKHLNLFDNDALVAGLTGRWKKVDRRWNVEHTAPPEEAFINHFIMRNKPWHPGYRHPSRDRWFEVLDRTAWTGWRPAEPEEKRP